MTKANPATITEGGKLLLDFIRNSKLSIPAFCEKHGLDRIGVQRVINGERWRRISLDLALALSRATGGEVPVEAFSKSTVGPPIKRSKRSRAA